MHEILIQAGHTNIEVREDEIKDIEVELIWDVRSTNRERKIIYWDVECKTFWRIGHQIPQKILSEGFSISNRKSVTVNDAQSRTDYIVIISDDCCGAFIVDKKTFEQQTVIKKNTKYMQKENFRNILLSSGILLLKKDGTWRRQ